MLVMSEYSKDLTYEQILEIHKSVVEQCKLNNDFKNWFTENGAGMTALSRYGVKLWEAEYDSDAVHNISYPKEMVYHPKVLEKLLWGEAKYTTNGVFWTDVTLCVEQVTCDFDEFVPNIVNPKYKWTKSLKLGLNFGQLIEDMYVSSAADFTLSVYNCSIIKISMVNGKLCFTCITGDRADEVVPYDMIDKGLVRKIMSSLPLSYWKVKEVYIIYNDDDISINNYIARKCDDGEYILTLF